MRMFRTKLLGRWLWYSSIVFFTAVLVASPVYRASAEGRMLVGRVSHVEGQLLRFVPAQKDWVATVKDTPFGMDDALYSGENAKAEFIMPNNTWVRIGASTQIQLIALKTDVTEVDVASGVARFYNKSSNALIKATTPFGYVVAQPGSVFDLYVGDQSAEVIALKGSVKFIHVGDNAKYEVAPGSSSVIADAKQVGAGDSNVDADWDDWNVERDSLWSKRVSVKGDSVRHLPSEMYDQAYELEENGRWESVNYQGQQRQFWRPTQVGSDWAPFTAGRWTEYYGDNTWIPDEPFGYATHHYGSWVWVNNAWYWGPPAAVGFGPNWYPGRVAWIGSGSDVGWVPLAPTERYYSHYAWGPAAILVGTAAVVGLTIGSLAYLNHAVVVPQHDFYGVNNYNSVRVANINRTTIINNYQTAPVVNDTIYKNYNADPNRNNFTDANVANKPHQSVLNRIEHNQGIAKQEAVRVNANTLRQNVTQARPVALSTQTKVEAPRVTHRVVPSSQVNKPASEVQFQTGELKQKPKPVEAPRPGVAGQPAVEPGKGVPGRPGEKMQPTEPRRPGQGPITPLKPGEKVRPGETKQPVESAGPPKSPREQMMKPGEGGPRAPGAGPESPRQKETLTPHGPKTKPQIQEGPRPGQQQSPSQQPAVQHEQQPQPHQQQMQQPQPRHEQQPQPRREPQPQQPAVQHEQQPQPHQQQMQQPQPRHEQQPQPRREPQPQTQQPAVQREQQPQPHQQQMQQPQPRHEQQPQPRREPQPQTQQPAVQHEQQPQPHQQQQQHQQGGDKEKQKEKGHEQQQ